MLVVILSWQLCVVTWCWCTYRYSECSPQLASFVPGSCTRATGSLCEFCEVHPVSSEPMLNCLQFYRLFSSRLKKYQLHSMRFVYSEFSFQVWSIVALCVHRILKSWRPLFQEGVDVSGVTVAYTVRAMDAGPVIASERVNIDPNIKVCYSWSMCVPCKFMAANMRCLVELIRR